MSNVSETKKEERARNFMKMFLELRSENQEKIENIQFGMILAQSTEQKNIAKTHLKLM